MATKVSKENNLLIIDNGIKIHSLNGAWCSIQFKNERVYISDEGINQNPNSYIIPFTEFQDGEGTPITTETEIRTYLSDKVG